MTLFSFDPATGVSTGYGNPTEADGEIYNMVWSREKLFMASYTGAVLTRFQPHRPWLLDHSLQANPAHLGLIKTKGLQLHRPHGRALGPDGVVYFAAYGDYGCEDSGIARIDPETDAVTSWIFPDTTFNALTYVPDTDQLLVCELRKQEQGIRFTFLCPRTGSVLNSQVMITDQGAVTAWLPDAQGTVYGLHAYRATLFAFSLAEGRIVRRLEEMRVGDHCYNALVFGPHGRIWGLTNRCVYAVDPDLSHAGPLAEYEDHANGNFYRFGLAFGPDRALYFPNGTHLMRLKD